MVKLLRVDVYIKDQLPDKITSLEFRNLSEP